MRSESRRRYVHEIAPPSTSKKWWTRARVIDQSNIGPDNDREKIWTFTFFIVVSIPNWVVYQRTCLCWCHHHHWFWRNWAIWTWAEVASSWTLSSWVSCRWLPSISVESQIHIWGSLPVVPTCQPCRHSHKMWLCCWVLVHYHSLLPTLVAYDHRSYFYDEW